MTTKDEEFPSSPILGPSVADINEALDYMSDHTSKAFSPGWHQRIGALLSHYRDALTAPLSIDEYVNAALKDGAAVTKLKKLQDRGLMPPYAFNNEIRSINARPE